MSQSLNAQFDKAIGDHDTDLCRDLLLCGVNVNARDDYKRTALTRCIWYGFNDIVDLLLAHGAKVNVADDGGWTPLQWAAFKGCVATCEMLLAKGAKINAKNTNDRNALHWAASENRVDVCLLLLERGVRAQALDDEGLTPAQVAIKASHSQCASAIQSWMARQAACAALSEGSCKTSKKRRSNEVRI